VTAAAVAAPCRVLHAATAASTRMTTAIRAWRTTEPATVAPIASAAAIRTDWAWRLRRPEGR
jgi:hypothetical protein